MGQLTRSDLHDTAGLICGFWLHSDRDPSRVDAMPAAVSLESEPVWLHLALSDRRAQDWVARHPQLSEAARELLLSDDTHVRLITSRSSLFGVLGDLHFDFDTDPDKLGALFIYVDERIIVTGRHQPLKTIDQVRREMQSCDESVPGTFALLSRILDQMSRMYQAVTEQLSGELDTAEDRVLRDRHEGIGNSLNQVRRVIAQLRRHLAANRQAMARAIPTAPAFCLDSGASALRDVVDRLERITHDLELVQDRARLLQDEIARRVNEATGRNLYFLSIITAIFLPVTLITGIFGMNVGGLPWIQHSGGFWWVLALMAATVTATLGVLRWRGLF